VLLLFIQCDVVTTYTLQLAVFTTVFIYSTSTTADYVMYLKHQTFCCHETVVRMLNDLKLVLATYSKSAVVDLIRFYFQALRHINPHRFSDSITGPLD
jgi:hypothetical protein